MSETNISREITKVLKARGWRVWRLPAGKVRSKGGWIHMLPTGTPDRVALKDGRIVFLEVKTPDAKPRKDQWEQRLVQEELRAEGFIVAEVRSVAEALEAVK